jgi:hypothetical protein
MIVTTRRTMLTLSPLAAIRLSQQQLQFRACLFLSHRIAVMRCLIRYKVVTPEVPRVE